MGGGARGAYQVGVLKGVGEITHELGVRQPFPIITGVSAGGLNACHLAAYADDMRASIQQLVHQWATLRTEHVFRVDLWSLAKIAGRGLLELLLGGLIRKKQLVKRSLLDTTPLQEFAKTGVPWERIQQNVDQHHLHSLALTAVSYTDGTSHTFFQGHPEIESWERLLRTSERTILEPRHLLASSAIPLLFSPVLMDGGYFGDGSLRNYHPLSPAIQCGADRL